MRPRPTPATATAIGQAHGQHRAERHDEDDDGEGEADQLGLGRLEPGEDLAADLDLQAGDLRTRSPRPPRASAAPISPDSAKVTSSLISTRARRPGRRARPRSAIWPNASGAYGLVTVTPSASSVDGEELTPRRRGRRGRRRPGRPEHDGAPGAGAEPPEAVLEHLEPGRGSRTRAPPGSRRSRSRRCRPTTPASTIVGDPRHDDRAAVQEAPAGEVHVHGGSPPVAPDAATSGAYERAGAGPRQPL